MALSRIGGLYTLTSLQIGDIRSYVSRLFLLVAYEALKLVFLVDNGPWTVSSGPSRPAELWQLLVYKSRGSPFANRLRDYRNVHVSGWQGCFGNESSNRRAEAGHEEEGGWLSLLVALQRTCKEQTRTKKPLHRLYGCVAFEVAWSDIRGINYSNELQTDTCVSLEVKVMTKREFDSLEQARACYETILSGTKDVDQNLNVVKKPCGKTAATIAKCRGSVASHQELVLEQAQAPSVDLDGPSGGHWSSGTVDKKQIRKGRQEDIRSYKNRSCAALINELSRSYISSRTSRFETPLDPVKSGSLPPKYSTPPSSPSPYSEHLLHNLFQNISSHQHKDSKKSCIVPVSEDIDSVSYENIMHNTKQAGECALSADEGLENSKVSLDTTDFSVLSCSTFDTTRSLGCSRCRGIRESIPFWERTQGCVLCIANTEVRPDLVYGHPDRLIAVAETYRDILILFRFSEPLLPLELQRIITADWRLLKMLESGLPPWVIFLQSYPILCHVYRPWMRPLCRTVYYLISIVTVLIGFYDLYKNVPILKATAAHICGPLFQWIEEWGVVSRLKYLGTMLFLQNCEKAFEWAIAVTQASRQISILLIRPVLQPLMLFGEAFLPLWEGLTNVVQTVYQFIWITFSLISLSLSHILSTLVWPFMAFLSAVWHLGKAILCPVFSAIWNFFILPIQLMRLVGSLFGALSFRVINGLQNFWLAINNALQLLLAFGSASLQSLQIVQPYVPGPSMWRTLWNDILSKVFHAVNGIVKGLAAFIAACNRHRLSIYNQLVEFLFHSSHMLKSGQHAALKTCRQCFLLPNPVNLGTAAVVLEVVQEPEPQEGAQLLSEVLPNLRCRSKEPTSTTPLLMQGT